MSSWAQSSTFLSHFEKRFAALDRMIFENRQEVKTKDGYEDGDKDILHFYNGEKFMDVSDDIFSPVNDLFEEQVEERVRSMKGENGLEISGQAYYRSSQTPSIDDDDANTPYNVKMQVEVGWDYLKSSLYRRKGKIKEIQIKGDLDKAEYMEHTLFNRAMLLEEIIKEHHDSIMMGLLLQQKKNLDILFECQKDLLKRHVVESKTVVGILERKSALDHKLDFYAGAKFKVAKDLWPHRPQMLKIDTVRLNDDVKGQTFEIRKLQLERSLIDQKISNTKYINSASLKPYVRYSYYSVPASSNRSNIDVGVNVKFPLTWNTKSKKKELRAQKQLLVYQEENVKKNMAEDIEIVLLQVEHLNFRCDNEYSRVLEYYTYLQEKKKGYDRYPTEYSMPSRMEDYVMYIDKLINLEELLRQRDEQMVELQKLLPHRNILKYCSFYDLYK